MKAELLKVLLEILHRRGADFLLLENCDPVAFLHNENTQLACLTGFSGSAGEGVLRADGKTFLLVDPRYHLQAQEHTTEEIELIKIQMGESFLDALTRLVPKGAKMLVSSCISLNRFKKIKGKFKNIEALDFEIHKTPNVKTLTSLVQIPLEISGTSAKEKIDKIASIVAKKGAEAYFISGVEDIAYLTNLRGRDFEYSSTFRAKMIISANGEAILFSDHKGVGARPYQEYEKYLRNLRGNVLYYPPHTTLHDFELMNLTGAPVELRQNPVSKMMSIKNAAEIAHLKACFARTDAALERFKPQIKEGLTERELKEIIERELLRSTDGASALSFPTILSVGKNGASIHYNGFDDSVRLKHGDLVLLDCGAYYKGGYATDITRVFVCGEPSQIQKRVYTLVLQAFMKAYHSDTDNPTELDKIAREFLKKHAVKELEGFVFPHALGHGIGINVHQAPPTLSPRSKGRLKKGMVFSIEPGLYRDNAFGVRFENCVYVEMSVNKNGKKQTLSHFEFEKKLVDEKMLSKKEQNWLKSF